MDNPNIIHKTWQIRSVLLQTNEVKIGNATYVINRQFNQEHKIKDVILESISLRNKQNSIQGYTSSVSANPQSAPIMRQIS